jgi:hypothetical protein
MNNRRSERLKVHIYTWHTLKGQRRQFQSTTKEICNDTSNTFHLAGNPAQIRTVRHKSTNTPHYRCVTELMGNIIKLTMTAIPWIRRLGACVLGLIPGQTMWDLWWTRWQWDRFLCEYFSILPVSIILPMLHTSLASPAIHNPGN